MTSIFRDLRYAARSLARSRGLVIVSVLALTIGIGLTTMMFSIVYGALLKGLPFDEADRIVLVQRANLARGMQRASLPIHDYLDMRAQQHSFTDLAAYSTGTVNVSGTEKADRFQGAFVTANLLRVLRVRPILGRDFRQGEDQPGAERVALIGHAMWMNRFAGDRGVIGRPIRANGVAYTVIGVLPEGFLFPEREEIWLPIDVNPLALKRGEGQWMDVVGRLRPGVSLDQASADVASVAKRLETAYKESNEGMTASAVSFVEGSLGPEPRQLLFTMLGAVFLVLLIACANVANLLLDRAAHRTREVGIRTALGASRFVVVRQFLAEALVLSALGALFGVLVARAGISIFNSAIADTNVPFFIDIRLHPPVLLFAIAVALLASVVAAALPAYQSSRTDIAEILKDESRGASSFRIGRLSRSLVIVEIALSCGLLVAAGLMIRTIANLRTLDYGFQTHGILTARVGFPATYTDTLAQARFFESLVQRLSELPAVRAAALSSQLPGTGDGGGSFAVEGRSYATDRDYPEASTIVVTPGFAEVFSLAPLQGRALGSQDRRGTEPVAVVNQAFARAFFKGESPLGHRIRTGTSHSADAWMTIVGVQPDSYSGDPARPRRPLIVMPLSQRHVNFVSIAVRAGGNALALTPAVRATVSALDPDIPIYWVYSMDEALARPSWFYRVFGTIFMLFGFVALFLASVGLYAVMAFSVGRRTRELGIRMALGAQGRDVLSLILRQGAVQLAIGLVAGLALAAGLSQLLQVVLFQVEPRDPVIFSAVVLVLGGAGMAACLIPARRATRVDPMMALWE